MSRSIIVLFALLGALLVSGAASSAETPAAQESKEVNVLKQILAKREKMRDSSDRLKPAMRAERRAHLSEDSREIMTKQIMQAISEVMNSECMSDRDYHGWVDFGRRDTE
ncbi:gastrin/cholecystokinin-like peptide [Melanotaenia boesemani]|uniref:gastrin/cholecystokinin-like peptide n=1 Tax=Melanotaenia boesemani TaxID=1250792 RepID=UPI001C046C33|nr:gastrin/cholecystokinin-like peptide [Melanotaenia boesemani]